MNISLENIIDRVNIDSIGTRDLTLSPEEFFMDTEGKLRLKNTDIRYDFNDWSLSQACSSLGMPIRYERRLMDMNPMLLSKQFNYWKNMTDKPVLLRTKNSRIRGYLSTSYSIYNNSELCDTLKDISQNTDFGDPSSFYMDEKRFHIRFVIDSPIDAGKTVIGLNDILKTGVDITNSEVGAASVSIVPMVYRLVCTNGLRAWRRNSESEQLSFRHSRKDTSQFHSLINGAIVSALDSNHELLDKFIASKQIDVLDPNKIIEDLLTRNKFTQTDIKNVQEEYALEPDPTKYGIINAITGAAKKYGNEERLQMESFAGKLLTLSVA